MVTFLTIIFIIMALLLAFFILLQQGKGDMGLGALSNSTQMLFGGSGGQSFFEKVTWTLGALFIFGALGLSLLQTKATKESRLASFTIAKTAAQTADQSTEAAKAEQAQSVATENQDQ